MLSMSCLSNLQHHQDWWRRRIFFSDISVLCQGTKAVPHFAFLEKGSLEKCCKCSKRCVNRVLSAGCASWGQQETCVPPAKGEQVFCTHRALKPLVLLVPSTGMGTWPLSCYHTIPRAGPVPTHAPAVAACLSVCLQQHAGRGPGQTAALCGGSGSLARPCQVVGMAAFPCFFFCCCCLLAY